MNNTAVEIEKRLLDKWILFCTNKNVLLSARLTRVEQVETVAQLSFFKIYDNQNIEVHVVESL